MSPPEIDESKWSANMRDFLYRSSGTLMGLVQIEPKKRSLMFLNVVYGFVLFILAASYTANLASFLIVVLLVLLSLLSFILCRACYESERHQPSYV